MKKDKYSLLKERIVEKTGIETITITIDGLSIIVDDYSKPECLVHVGNYYGGMAVYEGDNSKVGITEQDLIDFNILQPIESDNGIQQSYPVISPYGTPIVNEMDGDNWITTLPGSSWKHPGLADSTIESLKKEHDIDNVLAKIDLNCNLPLHTTNDIPMFDPTICEQIALLGRQTVNKFKLNNFFNELISKHNYTLDDVKKEDINSGKKLSNTDWHEYNAENNKLEYIRFNLESIETPFKPRKEIPMFDPNIVKNIPNLCRTFNNSFKMEVVDKMVESFKPRKEIIKIFNKLIYQFKNITKKDFKRLRTYVISGKDDYYHINYGNELHLMIHHLKLNLPTGTTLIHLDNLIVDIRRIILEGKPTVKFNLNIEEFNLFKKWLLDNSERIEDGN